MEKPIEKPSASPSFCPAHSQAIEYICVDPSCNLGAHCCLYCVKDSHSGCDDNLIIEVERISQVFEFKPTTINFEEEKQLLAEAIKKQQEQFARQASEFEAAFDKIISGKIEEISKDGQSVQLLKKFYNISFDSDQGIYKAESCFDVPEHEQALMAKNFQKDIESIFKAFAKELQGLPLEFQSSLKTASFNLHKNIQLQKKGSSLYFSRIKGNSDFNYFSALYQIPMKAPIKLEIKIESVNSGDPYLDVGIMPEKKFKTFAKDPVVSFANETFSYCGTSQSGMEGSYGSAVFKAGFVFYMEFSPMTQSLVFSSQDKVVNLYKKNLSKEEQYYFFLTLYHPEAACFVKVLR